MEELTAELLAKIKEVFTAEMVRSSDARAIYKRIRNKSATYEDAYKYARIVANARRKAFKRVLNSSVLPDGLMSFETADGIIRDTLPADFSNVVGVSAEVQQILNDNIGVGLKPIKATLEPDRIDGIIKRLSGGELFDDIAWILDEPVSNIMLSSVDSTIKANAEFQASAGIEVTVSRTTNGENCEWCSRMAGVYKYPGVPGDVFKRHERCTCTVTYDGKKLTAYTSKAGRQNTFRY